MSGAMYVAAAGALLQQMRLEVLSNNLANVNTIGFKEEKPVFRHALENGAPAVQAPADPNADVILSPYAPPMTYRTNFDGGPQQKTGNPLDLALTGDGFFAVQTPGGTQYTRKGNFTLDTEGVLTTQEGYPVLGQGGPITIDGNRVDIDQTGQVQVDGDVVDTLKIVVFNDPSLLKRDSDNLFSAEAAGSLPTESEHPLVSQGFVEMANVDGVRTMTEMIETLRVFEAYQKVMRTADEATAKTINDVGRTS